MLRWVVVASYCLLLALPIYGDDSYLCTPPLSQIDTLAATDSKSTLYYFSPCSQISLEECGTATLCAKTSDGKFREYSEPLLTQQSDDLYNISYSSGIEVLVEFSDGEVVNSTRIVVSSNGQTVSLPMEIKELENDYFYADEGSANESTTSSVPLPSPSPSSMMLSSTEVQWSSQWSTSVVSSPAYTTHSSPVTSSTAHSPDRSPPPTTSPGGLPRPTNTPGGSPPPTPSRSSPPTASPGGPPRPTNTPGGSPPPSRTPTSSTRSSSSSSSSQTSTSPSSLPVPAGLSCTTKIVIAVAITFVTTAVLVVITMLAVLIFCKKHSKKGSSYVRLAPTVYFDDDDDNE